MFRIGEVSRLFHISISTLRYYDRTGLVCPEYTDSDTGYRYYGAAQFECLNTIRYLRELDMPLDRIAGFLQNRDIGKIQELLQNQEAEIEKREQRLKMIRRKIRNRLSQIQDALSSRLDEICLVDTPPRRIASIRQSLGPSDYQELEYSIRLLEESEEGTSIFLGKIGVGVSGERLRRGEYHSYDVVFLLLDEEDTFRGDTTVLPAQTCAAVRFQGRHEQAPGYYGRLMEYIRREGYAVAGFSREITMIDYGLTNDTSKFVTEIQIPVNKSRPT